MSVEDTLAERGKRYGDFTDHAEICQRLKLAMIAGSARWTRLSDVQKQALEVIADKIARILSGDPNYADNWHDIQGYAKLVEDRLPKAPPQHPDDIYAQFAAQIGTTDRKVGKAAALGASYELAAQQPMLCPGCEYPDDGTGTHYTTCSKLTAPEGFVAEVEATFDELEATRTTEVVEELRLPDPAPTSCPGCGREEGLKHRRGCPNLTAKILAQCGESAPKDDPWAGAPEWAKYKAQDGNGDWYFYDLKPEKQHDDQWSRQAKVKGQCMFVNAGDPNPNWRDTLIERT